MNRSNMPLVTPLPRASVASDATPADAERVSELRQELAILSKTIAGVTAARVAQAERLGENGAEKLRAQIDANPLPSMAIAAAAGALIAVFIVPKRTSQFRFNNPGTYNAGNMMSAIRHSRPDTQPITSRLERVVEAIGKMDASALTTSPVYDTIKSWLQTFTSSLGKR